jgi:hypothetical protein
MINKKNIPLLAIVIIVCLIMAFVDAVISPGYAVKSVIKLLVWTVTIYAFDCRTIFCRTSV